MNSNMPPLTQIEVVTMKETELRSEERMLMLTQTIQREKSRSGYMRWTTGQPYHRTTPSLKNCPIPIEAQYDVAQVQDTKHAKQISRMNLRHVRSVNEQLLLRKLTQLESRLRIAILLQLHIEQHLSMRSKLLLRWCLEQLQ